MQTYKIEKIEPSLYKGLVNNIEVEKDNSYVTNGFVVHNCSPSAGLDVFFNRTKIDEQEKKEYEDKGGYRVFHPFDPSHRYGMGVDVAGGVGLDSSTSVCIDFSGRVARVVGTFESNTIAPDIFGHELKRQGDMFGSCLIAVENNKFDMTIGILKTIYPIDRIYKQQQSEKKILLGYATQYGWNTNSKTKPEMLFELKKAIEDELLELSDARLIAELKSYSRDDLMDRELDGRLSTRHFDLLVAASIAFQMRNHAEVTQEKENIKWEDHESKETLYPDIGI